LENFSSNNILHGPQNRTQRLQDGESWATGRHQFLITLLYYTSLRKVDENVDPAKFGRLRSAFPHLGFGVPCWCGVGGPCSALGCQPCWSLGACNGKYLDPAGDRDRYGSQNQAYGGTKISGDCPRGLAAQGVTSDLATCGPVQFVLAQSILDKIYHL